MKARPHFLERDGYDTSKMVGYGKPYRGVIMTYETPLVGQSLSGMLLGAVPLYTSTIQRVQPLNQDGDAALSVIETLNSVYVVSALTP
jgi:hypothetical protein